MWKVLKLFVLRTLSSQSAQFADLASFKQGVGLSVVFKKVCADRCWAHFVKTVDIFRRHAPGRQELRTAKPGGRDLVGPSAEYAP